MLPAFLFLTSQPFRQNQIQDQENHGVKGHHTQKGLEGPKAEGEHHKEGGGTGKKGDDPGQAEGLVDDLLFPLIDLLDPGLFHGLGVAQEIGGPNQQNHGTQGDAGGRPHVEALDELRDSLIPINEQDEAHKPGDAHRQHPEGEHTPVADGLFKIVGIE